MFADDVKLIQAFQDEQQLQLDLVCSSSCGCCKALIIIKIFPAVSGNTRSYNYMEPPSKMSGKRRYCRVPQRVNLLQLKESVHICACACSG